MSRDRFREELVAVHYKDLPGSFRELKVEELPVLGHGMRSEREGDLYVSEREQVKSWSPGERGTDNSVRKLS